MEDQLGFGISIWHFALDEGELGPLSLDEVEKLVQEGKIRPHVLAWKKGAPKWEAAREFPELESLFGGPSVSEQLASEDPPPFPRKKKSDPTPLMPRRQNNLTQSTTRSSPSTKSRLAVGITTLLILGSLGAGFFVLNGEDGEWSKPNIETTSVGAANREAMNAAASNEANADEREEALQRLSSLAESAPPPQIAPPTDATNIQDTSRDTSANPLPSAAGAHPIMNTPTLVPAASPAESPVAETVASPPIAPAEVQLPSTSMNTVESFKASPAPIPESSPTEIVVQEKPAQPTGTISVPAVQPSEPSSNSTSSTNSTGRQEYETSRQKAAGLRNRIAQVQNARMTSYKNAILSSADTLLSQSRSLADKGDWESAKVYTDGAIKAMNESLSKLELN